MPPAREAQSPNHWASRLGLFLNKRLALSCVNLANWEVVQGEGSGPWWDHTGV